MNRFTTIFAIAVLGAGFAASALAQSSAPRPGQSGQRTSPATPGQQGQQNRATPMQQAQQRVLAQLNLNADQKRRVDALQRRSSEQMRTLRESNKPREERMKAAQEAREANRKALMAILTPAQQKKYTELMDAEMKKMREQRGQGRGDGPNNRPSGQRTNRA